MPLWIIISYIIVSILIIFATINMHKKEKKQFVSSSVRIFITYTIVFAAVWVFNIKVPEFILFLTMIPAFMSCFFGYYIGLYIRSTTFDRYLHAFCAFSYSLFSYFLVADFVDTGSSKVFQAMFIFAAGNALGAIFELLESYHDTKPKNTIKDQKGLKDTDMDMLFNLFGSAVSSIFAFIFLL